MMEEFLSSPAFGPVMMALGLLIGALIFNVKQWEAHWKADAIAASNVLSKAGLVHLPKILTALGSGDLVAAFQEIKSVAATLHDPAQRAAEFSQLYQRLLTDALKDPTQAKALQQLANDAVAAFASGNPAADAPQLAIDAKAFADAVASSIAAQFPKPQQPSAPASGLTVTAANVLPGHVITATATPGSPAAAAASAS